MNTTKKNYREEFIKSLKGDDPKALTKLWRSRANDSFYVILEQLKSLTDKYFVNETNPLIYAMMAYCFDGNKYKTVEKIRAAINPIVTENCEDGDEIINTFVNLEECSDFDESIVLLDINEEIPVGTYYNLVLSGFDVNYGIKGKYFRVIFNGEKLKYVFDAYADEEDVKWIKENLFIKLPGENKNITRDITISLQDKLDEKYYDLIYLTDAVPVKYIDNTDKNNIITLEFECDKYYFCSECDKQIIEDIKNCIEYRLNTILTDECNGEEDCDGECDWPPLTEKSTTLDVSNIKGIQFRLSGYYNDDSLHFSNLKLSYSSTSDFVFELSSLNKDNLDFHKKLMYKVDDENDKRNAIKRSVLNDMKIELYDFDENNLYEIVELKNAYVIAIGDDNIKIVCDTFFVSDQDNDQISNYIRAQLGLVMGNIYRYMNFDLDKLYSEQY